MNAKKPSKDKRTFNSLMKQNFGKKKGAKEIKKPKVTVGAFGICKFLKAKLDFNDNTEKLFKAMKESKVKNLIKKEVINEAK